MLTRIKIEQLFNTFNYDIELNKEGITLLTGPNGYGKTTILRILDAIEKNNPIILFQLPFKRIILEFSDRNKIDLDKSDIKYDEIIKKAKSIEYSLNNFLQNTPYYQLNENIWVDSRSNKKFNLDEIFEELHAKLPDERSFDMPPIYFIREQRLLITNYANNKEQENVAPFKKTIETCAVDFKSIISDVLAKSSQIVQELDANFPHRLFQQKQKISELEFNSRFNAIKQKQKQLSSYDLLHFKEDSHPSYLDDNARALHVYIEDTEKKLQVFDELLHKLDLFTTILNERRFTFKRISISKNEGFTIVSNNGLPLQLTDLSSGEQQEVVILYELLFKVTAGTLVLIDEPELSLHVVWQMEFLNDLFKIIAGQDIQVIVATHSPQIINDRWDLTVDLGELHDVNNPH
jgi:predicted ATP-binding protein involved in virulence